jgi:hypothetical protein
LEELFERKMSIMMQSMQTAMEKQYAPMLQRLAELERGVSPSSPVLVPTVVPSSSSVLSSTTVSSSTAALSSGSSVLPVSVAPPSHTGEVKPVRLTNFPIYDGTSSFKLWLKRWDAKMRTGNYSDRTKLATITDYLSADINQWIADLDSKTQSNYSELLKVLKERFGAQSHSTGAQVQLLLDTKQLPGESIYTYSSRFKSAREDCDVDVGSEALVEFFIDGLCDELQDKVRDEIKDGESDISVVIDVAKKREIKLAKKKAAKERHAKLSTPLKVSSPPTAAVSSIIGVSPSPSKCVVCNGAPTPGKAMCKPCWNLTKQVKRGKNQSQSVNTNSAVISPSQAGSTSAPVVSPSQVSSTNAPVIVPTQSSTATKPDFTVNKVKFAIANDSSPRPLDWSNEKLKGEKRCYYCSELLSNHSAMCKDLYPFWGQTEVRTLLRKGMTVPKRSAMPTGPPMPP